MHHDRRDADRLRDEALVRHGLRVLRIDADLVERDVQAALGLILDALGLSRR